MCYSISERTLLIKCTCFWMRYCALVCLLVWQEKYRLCVCVCVCVCVSNSCDNSDSHPTKSRLEFSIQVLLQTRCRSELTKLHGTKLYDDNKIWRVFCSFNTSTAERVGSSNDGPELSPENSAFPIFAASLADRITEECVSPRSCLYCLWSAWNYSVPSAEYPCILYADCPHRPPIIASKASGTTSLTFNNPTLCSHSVCICIFWMDLRTNSDYFPMQH